jgi:hypothetical protein
MAVAPRDGIMPAKTGDYTRLTVALIIGTPVEIDSVEVAPTLVTGDIDYCHVTLL